MADSELDELITAVINSRKYKHVSPALVQKIGLRELSVRRNFKEAVKATKNKLHQVGGAYLDAQIPYQKALMQLQETAVSCAETAVSSPEQRAVCQQLMRLHSSTRERLPILAEFYETIFAQLPPIRSVLDIASGLNPLALPWMPLAADATYYAIDIYADMMAFLQKAFPLLGVHGDAECRDVITHPPTQSVDLALILKTLPVLDQVDKTAVSRLFDNLQARYILITFPVRSLGGRNKGMAANYAAQFDEWVNGRLWQYQRFEFTTELAFLIFVKDSHERTNDNGEIINAQPSVQNI